ncbi:hypothetical protein [Microcoleus phage My-WqHQDG]|nr:hypothetical protein [Microcoleus phage My-WqHQDG]
MINLDGLKWVTYKGTEWTIAGNITADRNHYNNKKKHITKGLELGLGGTELAEYKALYLAAHGEALKCPRLIVIDREKVLAYADYCSGAGGLGSPIMSTTVSTEDTIQEIVPDAVLQELLRITKDKGLDWVRYDNSLYLPMVQASLAKDMQSDDYSNNWRGCQPELPGIAKLLDGIELQSFKSSYIKDHGTWPFPRTRSLWIGNWEHAYAYLVQGKSPTATTFQTMGANSIQHTIAPSPIPQRAAPLMVCSAPLCPETWPSEEALVDRVFKLMELSTISMQREACLFNSLGSTPTTRRLDAIEYIPPDGSNPAKVHVYEFKKGGITAIHVTETVAAKGYIHLVRERYPDAKVCLFMVGNTIDPQAQRLLDCMLGVMYLPLSTLLNRILSSIISSWPREGHYQLRTHFLSKFQDILPTEMLSGPVMHPQIVATYHKPRPITTLN